MNFVLRDYQQEALDAIVSAIPVDENILLQAATGAGKTVIFCALIEWLLTRWPRIRIGVLAHRRELITQAKNKLLKVWPEAPVGLACASTGEVVDVDKPVVIGSVQTMIRRTKETAPFDLVIIDEAHRIPPMNKKSQYQAWLKIMKKYNPKLRILGCTATPFRLGHGYIYGSQFRNGSKNLFESLHYNIGIRRLQGLGYLTEYRAKKTVSMKPDLKTVSVSGDYNLGELGSLMSRQEHVGSAVHAVQKYAQDRKRIVVFCVTIEHAENIKKTFSAANILSASVHSQMPLPQRDMILRDFEKGRIRVLANVGVLTEGWDSPAVDCILMCRPTKSPALYCQMVGRGLRPHPDKTDVLILDLSDNCTVHGDPASPVVEIPKTTGLTSGPVWKSCPRCFELVAVGTKICPSCGHEFVLPPVAQNGKPTMADVNWERPPAPEPRVVKIIDAFLENFISRKGNRMLKLRLVCNINGSFVREFVNEFFDFEGNASDWSRGKARRLWNTLVGTEPPESVEEAMSRQGELLMSLPDHIEVIEKDKWLNVHRWQVMRSTEKVSING